MPSGDGWAVDVYDQYAKAPSGDAWAVDAYVGLGVFGTGMATIGVDVLSIMAAGEGPMASIGVDMNLTSTPSPARLKRWDGTQWVPIRVYYYDTVTNAWVMNG